MFNNLVQQLPAIPVADPPLDREKLLVAALHAASSISAGAADAAAQRKLDGKRFELRLRFGCGDAGSQDQHRGWSFDEKRRVLRLKVTPDIASADAVIKSVTGEGFEAVEGFWLSRPWLLIPACPPIEDPARAKPQMEAADGERVGQVAGTVPGRQVGIAQFFTQADSRTGRRLDRPYEATIVLDEGQTPGASGFDFALSGRLRALPDGRVIACSSVNPQVGPSCIISVDIDRAWIERADSGALVAEWSGG